jgi:hypothetical protein
VGGQEELARKLGITAAELRYWLSVSRNRPIPVFLKAVDIVCEYAAGRLGGNTDVHGGDSEGNEDTMEIHCRQDKARCLRCDGTDFTVAAASDDVVSSLKLKCATCGAVSTYGDVLVRLGADTLQRSTAAIVRLKKRQEQRLGSAPGFTQNAAGSSVPSAGSVSDPTDKK